MSVSNRSIQALVLDFGGVISKTLFETHTETEAALGLEKGSLTWRGPFDPPADPLWISMQAGEISEREYWLKRTLEVGEKLGKNWTAMSDLLIAARGQSPNDIIRPEFITLFSAVKTNGLKVAILSNELDLFYGSDFRDKLEFISEIDVIHDATYTQTLKPSRAAYDNLVNELGLNPVDCLFVDDQQRNIDGAIQAGLQTVHFNVMKPGQSYDQVASLLDLSS